MTAAIDSRRRLSRAAIAVAIVVALVGAWFVWGPRPRARDDGARRETGETSDAGPGGLLAAPNSAKRATEDAATGERSSESATGPASAPRVARAGPTWIVGEVVDEAGAPMPWARVGVLSVVTWRRRGAEHSQLLDHRGLKADAEGRFWWNSFVPGRAVWLTLDDDRAFRSEPVYATVGGEPVRLVAMRRSTARVRVVDSKGRPLEGASVTVRCVIPNDRGQWTLDGLHAADWSIAAAAVDRTDLRMTTDAAGVAVCPIPDPRVRMALDVTPSIDRDDLLAVHLMPWQAIDDTKVVLPIGLPVRGRVANARGLPLVAGVVRWTPEGGVSTDAKIAFDGTFELPPQPPGPIRLEVVDDHLLRPKESRPMVIAAGATDVVLVFDTGAELSIRVTNRAKAAGGKAYLSVDDAAGENRGFTAVDLENDGTAVLPGLLDEETYVLWIPTVVLDVPVSTDSSSPTPQRSGIVYRRGITLRDSPLVVEEVAGQPAEIELETDGRQQPESATIIERGVRCEAEFGYAGAGFRKDGAFRISHRARLSDLPPGEWAVRVAGSAFDEDGVKPVVIERTVKPGTILRLDFMPTPEGSK